MSDIFIVYFSSVTENTRKFVDKLNFDSARIPLTAKDPFLNVDKDYVLILPTYGGGKETKLVPKQVIKFLNDEKNRSYCRGVISSGNTNFGSAYALAGNVVAQKLHVPLLYRFELLGTPEDVEIVRDGLVRFWKNNNFNVSTDEA